MVVECAVQWKIDRTDSFRTVDRIIATPGLRPAVGVCGELGMGAGGLVGLHAGVQDAIQPSRKKFAARVSI